eukprot:TRINITY_DN20948_c0_g1_i1.p1 TRINITY_DN20948_c0_g1~~TRINITY_DN20948_c0_g1_i1.p1  ORF type:complete len:466 (-),score=133.28 TRINITY_DN20948_c0_g1_i1:316-1713(-)
MAETQTLAAQVEIEDDVHREFAPLSLDLCVAVWSLSTHSVRDIGLVCAEWASVLREARVHEHIGEYQYLLAVPWPSKWNLQCRLLRGDQHLLKPIGKQTRPTTLKLQTQAIQKWLNDCDFASVCADNHAIYVLIRREQGKKCLIGMFSQTTGDFLKEVYIQCDKTVLAIVSVCNRVLVVTGNALLEVTSDGVHQLARPPHNLTAVAATVLGADLFVSGTKLQQTQSEHGNQETKDQGQRQAKNGRRTKGKKEHKGVMLHYSPELDLWSELSQPPVALQSHAMAAHEPSGKVYVVGAQAKAVHCYDVAQNAWSVHSHGRQARTSPGVAVLGDRLFVFGGQYTASFESTDLCAPIKGAAPAEEAAPTPPEVAAAAAEGAAPEKRSRNIKKKKPSVWQTAGGMGELSAECCGVVIRQLEWLEKKEDEEAKRLARKLAKKASKEPFCFLCNTKGHTARDCLSAPTASHH